MKLALLVLISSLSFAVCTNPELTPEFELIEKLVKSDEGSIEILKDEYGRHIIDENGIAKVKITESEIQFNGNDSYMKEIDKGFAYYTVKLEGNSILPDKDISEVSRRMLEKYTVQKADKVLDKVEELHRKYLKENPRNVSKDDKMSNRLKDKQHWVSFYINPSTGELKPARNGLLKVKKFIKDENNKPKQVSTDYVTLKLVKGHVKFGKSIRYLTDQEVEEYKQNELPAIRKALDEAPIRLKQKKRKKK